MMASIALPAALPKWIAGSFGLSGADDRVFFLSGASQATTFARRLWGGRLQLTPKTDADAAAWESAIDQLADFANTFEMGPPTYRSGPRTGYSGANPLVAGAGQLGKSLAVDGLAGTTALAKAGDFFSFAAAGETELKRLTADATTSGGAVTLAFEPPIRNAPADNQSVEFQTPISTFGLVESTSVSSFDARGTRSFVLDVVEVFAA